MEKLSAELVVQLTMFLALVGGFIAILKFLFSLKDEVTNLRVEMKDLRSELKGEMKDLRVELKDEMKDLRIETKDELGKLSIRVERLEYKFDGKEVAQKKLEESVTEAVAKVENKVEKVQEVQTVQNVAVNERVEKIEYTVKESQKETNSILNKVLELLRSRDAVLQDCLLKNCHSALDAESSDIRAEAMGYRNKFGMTGTQVDCGTSPQ